MIQFNVKSLYELADVFSVGKTAVWVIICLLVLLMFLVVFYGGRDRARDFSITRGNSYIEGLRIVNKKDGADLWTITARRADFSKDETVAQLSGVTIDLKKEGAVLNADDGTYNMNSRDLILENNITIRQKDSVVSAAKLSWNSANGILSSEGKVLMQGDKFKIEGEGLAVTQNNKVTVTKNVKATFY